ncbi:MAG: preprotein translocase subunit SecY, partial [Phycisphaerales bacterium]|nr:preprotein translocase subunit SecY [Phycisphaerales bacterium]
IMPYISAAIIIQLVGSVSTSIKKLKEEGPTGQQKIQDWTRRLTVVLCIIQAVMWLGYISGNGLVYQQWANNPIWWIMATTALTAGTVFLMWIGEQIDRYGIGNGASMIIMAGILAGMPGAISWVIGNFDPSDSSKMDYAGLLLLVGGFVLVCAGSVLITVAQRRIPIQQAKQMRGRRMFGGARNYLPLRVNHGGVMPIIFASSLLIFPSLFFGWLSNVFPGSSFWATMAEEFRSGNGFLYVVTYIAMVYFFAYFWTTVQFQPKEMANSLRDNGSFIPGLRPGKRTADYLEKVMTRITYVGAGFLAFIAIVPQVIAATLEIPIFVSSFLGGTGLLIVVSVGLDLVQRIESNLIMRNYGGFLGPEGGGRIKGAYM